MNVMKRCDFWKSDLRSSSEVPPSTCKRTPTAFEHLPSTMCRSPENSLRPSLAYTARPDFLPPTQGSDFRTNFNFSRRSDRPTSHSARSSDSATFKWSPVPAFDGPTLDSSSSRSPSNSSSWSSRLEDSETPRSSGYSTFSCASSPGRLCPSGTTVDSLPFYRSVNCGRESSVIYPPATTCYPEPPAITIFLSEADIVPTYSVDEALAEFRALGHDSSFEPKPISTESSARHRSSRKKCGDPSCRKCASKGSRKKSSVRCVFCATNGEEDVEHMFKNASGQVVCPVLSAFKCKLCGASGGNAHTFKYCPKNPFSRGNPVAAGLPPGIPFFLADKRVRQTTGAN